MDEQELGLKEKLCKGVATPEENEYQKIEKVLAPFLRTLKKRKHEKADVLPAASEELYLNRSPKELFTRLQSAFRDALEFKTLLNETAELLKVVTKSKSVNLYFTDYDCGEILLCPKYYQDNFRLQKKYNIGRRTFPFSECSVVAIRAACVRYKRDMFLSLVDSWKAFDSTPSALLLRPTLALKCRPKVVECVESDLESGTYVAAHVAFTKEYVISSDIMGDVRFPLGIPNVPVVKSVLCLPIITNVKENCIGVIELYRECSDKPYDLVNLQICNALTAWMGIAVEQNSSRLNLVKEMEIQKEFSHLAELYFSGVIPFNKVVADLIKVAKSAVNAEKGAFYAFREPVPPNSEHDLQADAYEEEVNENNEVTVYKKSTRASFSKNQPSIVGHVARTGSILNIHDAYKDNRFNRKSDPPGHRTRSILAFPVKNESGVMAVLCLSNRMGQPYFRAEDVEFMESFMYQINLICGHCLLANTHSKTQLKLALMEKFLDFHLKPSADDVNDIKVFVQGEQQLPTGFLKFEWDLIVNEEDMVKYSAYIFLSSDVLEPCFEIQNMADFLLRVKKSYRPLLYHNFEHAFSVLHFAFNFILRNKEMYSPSENVALLLTALCHDVDHSGLSNTFLSLQNDIVYNLYGDFCGELHRYEMVLFLIQQTDLLSNVSQQTFKLISKNMKKLMMALDMAIHFQNRREITHLLNRDRFNWEDPDHRLLSQNMILMCSDFATSFKSFEVVKKYTATFYKELYKQGDMEKSMGFSPLSMLDRNKIDMCPENQIVLLSVVVLPVVDILTRLFPNLSMLGDLLSHTLKKWNEILEFRGQEMWKINEALMKDRKEKGGSHKITLSSTLSSIKTVLSDTRSTRSKF